MPDGESNRNDAVSQPSIDPFDPDAVGLQSPAIIGMAAEDLSEPTAGSGSEEEQRAKVEGLAVDLGHVLVDFDWTEVCCGFLLKNPALTRDDVGIAMAELSKLGWEHGRVKTAEFLAELNRLLKLTLSLEEFRAIWNNTFRENVQMADLLQALRRQKLPIWAISNTNEEHWLHLQSNYNIARHFDGRILSYEVGCSKPGSEILKILCERSGFKPANTLFVDDLLPNIEASRMFGFQVFRYSSAIDELKSKLATCGFVV